ncbi:MAG: Stp1/IreP family PP2C-type Ser/Thr phosphatase [bacterium]|nr:MAG: Stp1/IreP family PP2C-type Ser/Thr phosphatase [bacterium]
MSGSASQDIFEIGAASDRGSVREFNEDYYGVFEPETEELMASRGVLTVVSDGMGGHFSGGAASRTAVDALGEVYFEDSQGDALNALSWAFKEANRRVFEKVGEGRKGLAGTTCTAVALFGDRVHIAHAGDSRAYLVRDGAMHQLTRDHSVVGELVRQGMLDNDEARSHPHRNIITRAVGLRDEIDIDICRDIRIEEGDIVLLCSDGLFSMIAEDEIAEIASGAPPEDACERLVKRAKEEGGTDNITVIIAKRL